MEFLAWIFGTALLAFATGYLVGCNNNVPWHTYHLLRIEWTVKAIRNQLGRMEMTQEELAAELATVKDTVAKIGTETSTLLVKITDLEAVIAAGGSVSADVQAALDALKAQASIVDNLVPDSVP